MVYVGGVGPDDAEVTSTASLLGHRGAGAETGSGMAGEATSSLGGEFPECDPRI